MAVTRRGCLLAGVVAILASALTLGPPGAAAGAAGGEGGVLGGLLGTVTTTVVSVTSHGTASPDGSPPPAGAASTGEAPVTGTPPAAQEEAAGGGAAPGSSSREGSTREDAGGQLGGGNVAPRDAPPAARATRTQLAGAAPSAVRQVHRVSPVPTRTAGAVQAPDPALRRTGRPLARVFGAGGGLLVAATHGIVGAARSALPGPIVEGGEGLLAVIGAAGEGFASSPFLPAPPSLPPPARRAASRRTSAAATRRSGSPRAAPRAPGPVR